MKKNIKIKILFFLFLMAFFVGIKANAQSINVDASKLLARVEISLSPRSGSFIEGSTFQVPILLNTKNRSINGIEVRINFDSNKLMIINPTGGTSIIGVWTEPPKYDNKRGLASYVGVVPGGIVTESGLIGTITFKALASGNASVSVNSSSRILLNDGLGTDAQVGFGRADYNILIKAPEGVQIYSETHPIQYNWYNNNSPVLSWVKDQGVNEFSYILDNKPNTIPDNETDTITTTQSFENLNDGLWYFHIKANKNGAWGTTGHFLIRIDTAPPAEFKPEVNFLTANVIDAERTLVSFFTTDNLSGVDHYEVGIIDKTQPTTESPVFQQAESPFQVPLTPEGKLQVIVRAIDKAGNIRDESIDVRTPIAISKFINDYLIYILIGIILLGLIMLIIHYMIGHHIIRALNSFRQVLKREEKGEVEYITKPIEEKKEEVIIIPPPVKFTPPAYKEVEKKESVQEKKVEEIPVVQKTESKIEPTPIPEPLPPTEDYISKNNDNKSNWIDHLS